MPAFVVGYDPGGNGKHGMAVLRVRSEGDRWRPLDLQVTTESSLADTLDWVKNTCRHGRILAAGVDTLTEWNSGLGGWRPADCWLRKTYRAVQGGVIAPAALRGAMVINGAGFLQELAPRFRTDATTVTEAHPKVCYFALTGRIADFNEDAAEMVAWLASALEVEMPEGIFGKADHGFDAGMAVLAALRGVDGEWPLDLHNLPDADQSGRIQFYGETHYWWPQSPDDGRLR